MVANAADPKIMGLTQGTAQSFQSLIRSVGPISVGTTFSLLIPFKLSFCVFSLLMVSYLMSVFISLKLTDAVESKTLLTMDMERQRKMELEMVGKSSLLDNMESGVEHECTDEGNGKGAGAIS